MLGDKVFDISPGTPPIPALHEGDTLVLGNAPDFEAVLHQATGALDQVMSLTGNLQTLVNGVSRGEGTIGALVTSRTLYDQLNSTLATTNGLMVRLQNPRGTIGHLLDDPAMYNSLNHVLLSADTIVAQLNSSQGTVGKMLRDDSSIRDCCRASPLSIRSSAPWHTAKEPCSKLFTDQELYDRLLKSVTELNNVLVDVRRDPRRYTKGLITVF